MRLIKIGNCKLCDMVRVGHVTLLKAIAKEQSQLIPILKMIV